jgi:16S rRNA (uracil1498-N3)-methyltransferase
MRSAADAAPSFLYLPELTSLGESFALAGDEGRYLARVVRAREGERVTATDGIGGVATLLVEQIRPELLLRVESRAVVAAPVRSRLLCGAPEGERGDWLVEKLAEFGITEFCPVDTERVRWPAAVRRERWERLAVAALRQSRSAWLMQVAEAMPLAEAVAGCEAGERWLADPSGAELASRPWAGASPIEGAVGPSAGFSEDERRLLLERGFTPVRLAASRLRTETAALAVAALWAARRG